MLPAPPCRDTRADYALWFLLACSRAMRFTAPVALLAFCVLLAPACAKVDGSTVSAAVADVGSTAMHAMMAAGGAGSRKLQSVSVSCPSPSSGALTCNSGTQLLSYPGSGGVCDCSCGTNATAATDSTPGGNSAIVAVAASSACTAAACTAAFPTFCPAASYVMAQYFSWTALGTQVQSILSLTTTSCGTAAMCWGLDVQCSPSNIANGICPSNLAGTTIFQVHLL